MAMGKMKPRQESLFIATTQLAKSPGHPFYQSLNALLADAGFDSWIEGHCRQFYSHDDPRGRKSIAPGVYFRMLFVGYFEGIESQRGIAWRCADSLALREFLGLTLDQQPPDHSTLTNTRKRLPTGVFDEVFQFVLGIADAKKLLSGKTVGVDSTTLEANAAMKSIVRKETGEDWKEYVTRLMRAEGVIDEATEPTDEEVRRFDRKRKDKKVSNKEWQSTTDPDARITKMKDGTTHLAYKAEHVVNLASDIVLAAEVTPADQSDTATMIDSVIAAQLNLQAAGSTATIEEVVADKGYHSAEVLESCEELEFRTYIPEPRKPHGSKWTGKSSKLKEAVYGNRRRTKRSKSVTLQKRRSEVVERTFAHICETGGGRRNWLRGMEDVSKRHLMAAAAHNLGRVLFQLIGKGKPKAGKAAGAAAALAHLLQSTFAAGYALASRSLAARHQPDDNGKWPKLDDSRHIGIRYSSTGC